MRWLILTLIAIFAVFPKGHSNMAASCMRGWETHGGSNQCYSIMDVGVKRDFDQARDHCKELGGEILAVKDEEIKDFLADKLQTYSPVEGVYLNAKIVQGIWTWIGDNQQVDLNLLPIDQSGTGGCAVYTPQGNLKATNCSDQYNVICQRPAGFCPEDWTPFRDSCYYFSTVALAASGWPYVKTYCEQKGAHLIIITDPEENELIKSQMLDNYRDSYWIGLKSVPHDNFYWIDDSVMDYTMMWPKAKEDALNADDSECVYYRLVATDQPEPASIRPRSRRPEPPGQYESTWTPADCLQMRYYICEMELFPADHSNDTQFKRSENTPTDN